MDFALQPELTVCGIEELPLQRNRDVTHILSIIDPERADLNAFATYGNHVRTTLRFHDIISPIAGQIMPAPDHVETVLKFGEVFLAREDRNASSHVLVHCHIAFPGRRQL